MLKILFLFKKYLIMKTLFSVFLLLFSLFISKSVTSQEALIQSGNLDFLTGQTQIGVEFVYDGMKVGEFTEEIYLKQKKSEFKKAADYDKFQKKWNSDRKDFFEPKFIAEINKSLKRLDIAAGKDNSNAEYFMQVITYKTEPGYYGGSNTNKRNTYVDVLINFFKADNRDNILCVIKAEKNIGVTEEQNQMGETTLKLTNAYTIAADRIGKLILKIRTKKEKNTDVIPVKEKEIKEKELKEKDKEEQISEEVSEDEQNKESGNKKDKTEKQDKDVKKDSKDSKEGKPKSTDKTEKDKKVKKSKYDDMEF